jgi:hypothetical protein
MLRSAKSLGCSKYFHFGTNWAKDRAFYVGVGFFPFERISRTPIFSNHKLFSYTYLNLIFKDKNYFYIS